MTMIEVDRPIDLADLVGRVLGPTDWILVDQAKIDGFASVTGDHQWIHVDAARAAQELPEGKTIAHGFLSLSLLPVLIQSLYSVRRSSRGINYGLNRARFISPVPSGSRVRLRHTFTNVEPVQQGVRITAENVVEGEGFDKPVLVAETISLCFDE